MRSDFSLNTLNVLIDKKISQLFEPSPTVDANASKIPI